MATKEAKYLIVPSRSGTAHKPEAVQLIEELKKQGVSVYTPTLDISIGKDLSSLLEDCNKTFPPIKGCINAAMILNVSGYKRPKAVR